MFTFKRFLTAPIKRPAVVAVALSGLAFVQGQHPVYAAEDTSPHSEATLIAETTSIQPGKPFTVALRLKLAPHWHAYWKNPGDSGMPVAIQWELTKGFGAGPLQWPYPQRIVLPPLESYGYENEVWLPIQLTAPQNLIPGKAVVLKGKAKWLVCKTECVPASEAVSLSVPVAVTAPVANSRWQPKFAATRATLPKLAAGLGLQVTALRGKKEPGAAQNDLVVQLKIAGQLPFPAASYGEIHFYASDPSIIAHAKAQIVTTNGNILQIVLSPSEYAAEPAKRLRGVLVAPPGQTWDGARKVRAISIDLPVVSGTLIAGTADTGIGEYSAIDCQ